MVDYYGSHVPLSQTANVAVEDARTLSVTPWEQKMVQVIEKAIMNSDLGLTPVTAGTVIRVPLPPLTEERRRDLAKHINRDAEHAQGFGAQRPPGRSDRSQGVAEGARDHRGR